MLAVEVRFLHGTLRAHTSDTALTGVDDQGEWPPSPARLFSAFVAADGTGDRCRVTDGSELRLLETAAPPTIHADPRVARSRLAERFVVENAAATQTVQNYPLRKNTMVRPGTRLAPFDPVVVYVWDEVSPAPAQRWALELRAARIGYVGAADAPAQVRVLDAVPAQPAPPWTVDPAGGVVLPVPFDGLLAALDHAEETFAWGAQTRRSWLPARHARYRHPRDTASRGVVGETLWLRFDRAVPDHRMLDVAETLRDAVLAHYPADDVPSVLHGHGMRGASPTDGGGWQQVRYLPLVEVDHPFASGRVHGAALWLPPDLGDEVAAGVRTALLQVRRLVRAGRLNAGVALHDGAARPWAAHPKRWSGPATQWVSATPVVHERHGRVDDREVARWCAHAGVPAPVRWRLGRYPFAVGAVELRPSQVHSRYPNAQYSHLAIEFDKPVTGPVAVGRGRQFGLGLLAPVNRGRGVEA